MKKQYRHPITATLLTTAILALGALPVFAETLDANLDIYASDILLQAASTPHQFQLEVDPYPGENDGSYYVGLTSGVLHDITAGTYSDSFQMFCADFNHDISGLPVFYNINIESLVGPGEPDPSPGLGLSLQTLQTEALLGADFNGTLPTDSDVQHDIWNLSYTGNGPLPFTPPTAGMTLLMNSADAAYTAGADYSGAFLFDIINGDGQAFMPVDTIPFNHSSQPPTPEPGTWAMLGLGLIGLGSLKLRRNRR